MILDGGLKGREGEGPALQEAEGRTEAHRWAGAAGGMRAVPREKEG